ncbi:MAG: PKD domain-containing protein [Crocinitomicaceae bacterium]|nr:PKD domain-containing protein [Crocinitomicaceae bacterium]
MNTEFIFTPEDMNQNVNFVWEFGDGSFSNSKIASHTYTRSGTFNVTLSLKDAKTNKTLSKSAVEVVVNPVPAVNFAWEQSNNLIPTINFINLTEDADKFAWDIKGVKTSTETQIDYTFRKKGTYIVELSAGNEFGCTNTIQKPIEVKSDYNLLAPTAFTPNGDNKNDYFIPEALRIMDVDFTMVVFDKSGKVMYQTTDVNMPWDGNNATDNSIAEDGAYVWKVQFKNTNGELEMYEGQVIITR